MIRTAGDSNDRTNASPSREDGADSDRVRPSAAIRPPALLDATSVFDAAEVPRADGSVDGDPLKRRPRDPSAHDIADRLALRRRPACDAVLPADQPPSRRSALIVRCTDSRASGLAGRRSATGWSDPRPCAASQSAGADRGRLSVNRSVGATQSRRDPSTKIRAGVPTAPRQCATASRVASPLTRDRITRAAIDLQTAPPCATRTLCRVASYFFDAPRDAVTLSDASRDRTLA